MDLKSSVYWNVGGKKLIPSFVRSDYERPGVSTFTVQNYPDFTVQSVPGYRNHMGMIESAFGTQNVTLIVQDQFGIADYSKISVALFFGK